MKLTKEVKDTIQMILGVSQPIMLKSTHNIGEIKKVFDALGFRFLCVDISLISLEELIDLTDKISLGLHGDKGILFLDKINRASHEVQQAAINLTLRNQVNLPEDWQAVPILSENSGHSLDPAFLSRVLMV